MSKESSPKKSQEEMVRYNLVLPKKLHDDVEKIAAKRNTKVAEIVRRCIKIGLLLEDPGSDFQFFVRDRTDGTEKQVMLL
jgi:hypothetical protein